MRRHAVAVVLIVVPGRVLRGRRSRPVHARQQGPDRLSGLVHLPGRWLPALDPLVARRSRPRYADRRTLSRSQRTRSRRALRSSRHDHRRQAGLPVLLAEPEDGEPPFPLDEGIRPRRRAGAALRRRDPAQARRRRRGAQEHHGRGEGIRPHLRHRVRHLGRQSRDVRADAERRLGVPGRRTEGDVASELSAAQRKARALRLGHGSERWQCPSAGRSPGRERSDRVVQVQGAGRSTASPTWAALPRDGEP